jgi:hypothetical protein
MHCRYSKWSPKYTEFVCTAPGIDGDQICTCSEILDLQEDIDITDNILMGDKIDFEQVDPEICKVFEEQKPEMSDNEFHEYLIQYNERINAIGTR